MKKIALILLTLISTLDFVHAKGKKNLTDPVITAKQVAIQTAIQEDNLQYLVDSCTSDELKKTLFAKVTYLHLAALSDSLKVGRYLVEEIGISPNAQSEAGSTPTIIAAYKYRISTDAKTSNEDAKVFLQYLLEHDGNADLKSFDKDGKAGMSAKDWAPELFN